MRTHAVSHCWRCQTGTDSPGRGLKGSAIVVRHPKEGSEDRSWFSTIHNNDNHTGETSRSNRQAYITIGTASTNTPRDTPREGGKERGIAAAYDVRIRRLGLKLFTGLPAVNFLLASCVSSCAIDSACIPRQPILLVSSAPLLFFRHYYSHSSSAYSLTNEACVFQY